MATYFEKHRQRYQQWRAIRRNGRTAIPQVVVHTYEAPAGRSAADGAKYLLTRSTPGSYHWLADALGGYLHLAPWSAETWHCVPSNNWSTGISMMAYADQWHRITATQRRNLVNGAALGAHRFSRWCVSQGKGAVPARRITRAQAMAGAHGFISHGEMDPGRRHDPGAGFPWAEFFAEFRRLEAGPRGSAPTPGEDWLDMATPEEVAQAVWRYAMDATEIDGIDIAEENAGTRLNWVRRYSVQQSRRAQETLIRVRGMESAIGALAESRGLDPDAVLALVAERTDAGVAQALKDFTITLSAED